jgi:hypothetical protein
MTQLSQQMQEKMTLVLSELRTKTIARMTETGERIRRRPQLQGDDSLQKIQHHPLMVQNDDGATIMNAAIGIPGLSMEMDAALDVAETLYGDRKATYARPQDEVRYTPRQERDIRDKNRMDLALFMDLDDKLNTLNTYIAQGYTLGLDWNGELIPWEELHGPVYTLKTSQVEPDKEFDYAPTSANYNFAPAANLPHAPRMSMRA